MTSWRPATEHPEGQVLVAYWTQFFGCNVLEYDIGFYDDPNDYTEGKGSGWCRWHGEQPIKVHAWMPLPELPPEKNATPAGGEGEE